MVTSGIYCIINIINKKIYVGSTINFDKRWGEHISALQRGIHHNPHLQRSWDKYGKITFEFDVLEYLDNPDELVEVEQLWMDVYREEGRELYNCGLAADCPMRGRGHTKETRSKMSKAWESRPPMSEETRSKMSRSRMGHETSAETRSKISKTLMGHPGAMSGTQTAEARLKRSKAQLGHPVSKEAREKLSKASKVAWARGDYDSEETRYNMGKGRRGKPLSEEHRNKIRGSYRGSGMSGKHHSEESRQRIGKANSRSYPTFIHIETDEIIPAGTNLSALCREWGLGQEGMRMVKNGKQYSHRGWILA